MTLTSTTNRSTHTGNNSTTAFSYSFKIFDQSEIDVYLDGVEKTITTHYTISGVDSDSGGNVTFTSGNTPGTGVAIVFVRNIAKTQTTDYTVTGQINPQTIEDALDKLTMQSQKNQLNVDESFGFADSVTDVGTVRISADASDRASKVLAFDSSGGLSADQEIGTSKGNWAASTAYVVRDIIKDTSNNNIYIALTAHTSSGSQPISSNTDSAKWRLLVDAAAATTSATAAATSATASATSATASASSASAASTSATNSASSATTSTTQASNSASSATSSASSATSSATSATASASSATAAAASATSAASNAGPHYGVSAGSANTYTLTPNPTLTSYAAGVDLLVKVNAANTGASTINVDSLGAKNIKKSDGSDPDAGDLPLNGIVELVYDGTNFQITGGGAASGKQTNINASDIFLLNARRLSDHSSNVLNVVDGFVDDFQDGSTQNNTAIDISGSSNIAHDNTSKYWQNARGSAGQTSTFPFTTESNYIQQEWTNTNLSTSQMTVVSVGHTVNSTGGGEYPISNSNAKIKTSGTTSGSVSVSPKIGSAMGYFDNGDKLTIPEHAAFIFGAGNYTIEAWLNLDHLTSSGDMGIIQLLREESAYNWSLYYHDSGKFKYEMKPSGSNTATLLDTSTTLAAGTWYHVAVVRNGTTTSLYLNGTSEDSATWDYTMRDDSGSADEEIGIGHHVAATFFHGWMDEMRVSKGVARYTANFTPSTSPFTSDSNTSLLLHFEGSDDSTTFTDSSSAGGSTATISSGSFPANCANGRIKLGSESYVDITARTSATQLALSSYPSNDDYDYIIRMSEFAGGVVKLNATSGGNVITEPVAAVATFATLKDSSAFSDVNSITRTETLNSQNVWYFVVMGPSGMSAYNDTDTVVTVWTGSYWKEVAQYTGSAWQYNTNTADSTATSWTNSTINDMLHATAQGVNSNAIFQMTGAELAGISDANLVASGGIVVPTITKVGVGVVLKSSSTSQNPESSLITIKYYASHSQGTFKSRVFGGTNMPPLAGSAPNNIVLEVIDKQISGTPAYKVSRDGGSNYDTISSWDIEDTLADGTTVRLADVTMAATSGTSPLVSIEQSGTAQDYRLYSLGLKYK